MEKGFLILSSLFVLSSKCCAKAISAIFSEGKFLLPLPSPDFPRPPSISNEKPLSSLYLLKYLRKDIFLIGYWLIFTSLWGGGVLRKIYPIKCIHISGRGNFFWLEISLPSGTNRRTINHCFIIISSLSLFHHYYETPKYIIKYWVYIIWSRMLVLPTSYLTVCGCTGWSDMFCWAPPFCIARCISPWDACRCYLLDCLWLYWLVRYIFLGTPFLYCSLYKSMRCLSVLPTWLFVAGLAGQIYFNGHPFVIFSHVRIVRHVEPTTHVFASIRQVF